MCFVVLTSLVVVENNSDLGSWYFLSLKMRWVDILKDMIRKYEQVLS